MLIMQSLELCFNWNFCYVSINYINYLFVAFSCQSDWMNTPFKDPFWRWTNFCYRTWSWTLNFLFLFLIVVPWCSPVSFRALFSVHPFLPDYEVSQLNGSLHKKPSSLTQTLVSRLKNLWRHISKRRTDFEAMPDRSLLGKSVLRHINRSESSFNQNQYCQFLSSNVHYKCSY